MKSELEKTTIKYYDDNAKRFLSSTANAEMSRQLIWFLDRVPEGAHILDWGCGSGRDSRSMLDAGYAVKAIDASDAMCAAASELTGLDVRHETFAELRAVNEFDGIWANASLLHVPSDELSNVLDIAARALKPSGILSASFKLGDFEGYRNGRWFTSMDEDHLACVLEDVPALQLLETMVTGDVREKRIGELWLNCMMRKAADERVATGCLVI